MTLTIDFISSKFSLFNREYFGGVLDMPEFRIVRVKSYLGRYHWKYGGYGSDGCRLLLESVIYISDRYDRSEFEYCNTLLHEMVHLYIRQKGIRDSRSHHGEVFYSIASRINREGGWRISVCA